MRYQSGAKSVLALCLLFTLVPTEAGAECCGYCVSDNCSGSCAGVGGCNIFCCNCDGGCVKQKPKDECNYWFNECLIWCMQGNCQYCSDNYIACMKRAGEPITGDFKAGAAVATNERKDRSRFSLMDTDGDKSISTMEFLTHFETARKSIEKIDTSKDGILSVEELHSFYATKIDGYEPVEGLKARNLKHLRLPSPKVLKEIFAAHDADKDGKISKKEAETGPRQELKPTPDSISR